MGKISEMRKWTIKKSTVMGKMRGAGSELTEIGKMMEVEVTLLTRIVMGKIRGRRK